MKPYLPARSVLAKIKGRLVSNRPSFNHSPLEDVADLLCESRHYSWVGIYLTLDSKSSPALVQDAAPHPAQIAVPGTLKKILVSMKVAGHEVGFLNVESDRENAFGSEDRVLLDRVAGLLARFLAGSGRYLVRRAAKPELAPTKAAAA